MLDFILNSSSFGIASSRRQAGFKDSDSPVAASFGALTLAAAENGVAAPDGAIAISGGSAAQGFQMSGNMVFPVTDGSAVAGTLEFSGTEQIMNVDVTPSTYSCAADVEAVAAAWQAADPVTARGILLRDGDGTGRARAVFPAKAFANVFEIAPHVWSENTDHPEWSFRGVTLGMVSLEAGCENVAIRGVRFRADLPENESAANGVLELRSPSVNLTVQQCEIQSTSLLSEWVAGNLINYSTSPLILRGIMTGGVGQHIGLSITDNHIHDVERGIVAVGAVQSEIKSNYIHDVFTNFTTCGGACDGLDILDNYGIHVWAAEQDTVGAIPQTSPHSAVGLSFDAPAAPDVFQNLRVMGNQFHVGWRRSKLHADNGLPAPQIQATGMKFNDPFLTDSYRNITVAHNLVVAQGICDQFIGADGVDEYNNTFAMAAGIGATSPASRNFAGAANVRSRDNIAGASIGVFDGSFDEDVPLVRTLDTMQGAGNLVFMTNGGSFDQDAQFAGHPDKGFEFLEVDEIAAAYTPVPSAFALRAARKKGALGTGYYAKGGQDSAPDFVQPVAVGAIPSDQPVTVWDGATHATLSGAVHSSGFPMQNSRKFTVAWEGALHPDQDDTTFYFFSFQSSAISLLRAADNELRLGCRDAGFATILEANANSDPITSANGTVRFALSVDLEDGRVLYARDGRVFPLGMDIPVMTSGFPNLQGAGYFNLHSDAANMSRFQGEFRQFLFMDEFVDLETQSGLNQLFDGTGAFRDWAPTGENISAGAKAIVIRGDAATLNAGLANGGDGGAFSVTGADVVDQGADIIAPQVISTQPSNSELDVDPGTQLIVTFDEDVIFGSGAIHLRHNDGGWSDVEVFDVLNHGGELGISGSVLTIAPSLPLTEGGQFALQIVPGAITDLAGNDFGGITNDSTFTFSTFQSAPAGREMVSLGTGYYADITPCLSNARYMVVAFRARVPHGNIVQFLNRKANFTDFTVYRNAGNGDRLGVTFEIHTGASSNIQSWGSAWSDGETHSVLIKVNVETGQSEMWMDGTSLGTTSTVGNFIKQPFAINGGSGEVAGTGFETDGMLISMRDTPEVYQAISWADVFAPVTHEPLFSDATVNGQMFEFACLTKNDWDNGANAGSGADFGANGTVTLV